MPDRDEINGDNKLSPQVITPLSVWINKRKEISDAKQLAQCYQKAMKKFSDVVRRDISSQLDGRGIGIDISALFYKGAIMELSKAAVYSLGERKARSILRQISEELRS